MSRTLKRRLAIAVALSALLAGGTAVALGATGSTQHRRHAHRHAHTRHGLLSAAATYLGIERAQLSEDLRSGRSLGEVALDTPGHSEAGLVAAILAARKGALSERVSALVKHSRSRYSPRAAALSYLGLSRQTLASQLRSGKSLAQIANATRGKSANGLIEALLAGAEQRLGAARTDRESKLRERLTRLVDRGHPARATHEPA